MRVPFRRRLGTRIFVAILCVSILGVILTVGVLATMAGRFLRNEIAARNLQIARLVAARAGLFFDESLTELQALARIFGPLPSARWISDTLFANVSLEFRRFGWIRLLREDGTPVASTGSSLSESVDVKANVVQGVSRGTRYISPVQIDSNFTPYLVVGVPTRLADGSPAAVFAELRLREIWQHLEGISLGSGASAFLVSGQGVLIAHSDKRVLLTPALREAIPQPPADIGDAGITTTADIRGRGSYLTSYFRLETPDWYAAISQPVAEAYLPADLLFRQAAILVAAVAVASILLGYVFSRQITVPLVQLVSGTLKVAAGDLGHRLSVRTNNEIGELAVSFNFMTLALQERSRELEASERKYRLVTERANDIIFALDQEGRFTFASGRLRTLAGIEPKEVLGRSLAEVMQLARPEEWHRMIDPGTSGDRMECSFFAELPTGDGKRLPLEVNVTRVAEPGEPPGFSGVARDVSERRRLEEQLAQAQKMEAIGRLAGGVAHDFNNLLTAILGYCEMARMEIGENPPAEASLDQIRRAGERAAALTRQLLAFSRRQVLAPRHLDLNQVVNGMAEMLRRLIGEQVTLVIRLSQGPASIRADKGQMEQVIMNLALNARDAMPEGGMLTIATRDHGAGVTLEVADTGTGMSPEVQAHLFEPFFTTKELGKGTGLGLSTVYGIVQQSGGTIAVDSALGAGSVFRVSFPCSRAEAEAVEQPSRAGSGGGETILLVEDEEVLRTLMRNVLSSAGYRVITAPDGASAFAAAERERGRLQLLVTDLILPGLGGKKVAEELASRIPSLAVLFISGYAADNLAQYERLPEGRAFLQKPFASDALLGRVRWLLDSVRKRSTGEA